MTTTETIRNLCAEAGVPEADMERIWHAAYLFNDDELKVRAAQMLVDAWKADHALAQ